MSNIKKQEEEKFRILPVFNEETHAEVWKQFAEKLTAKSVIASLKYVLFATDGPKLLVYVPTERIRDVLLDTNYFISLQGKFKDENISYDIHIDMDRFPEYDDGGDRPKPKTDMEKYQEMVIKNPAIEQLRKALDLEFDN